VSPGHAGSLGHPCPVPLRLVGVPPLLTSRAAQQRIRLHRSTDFLDRLWLYLSGSCRPEPQLPEIHMRLVSLNRWCHRTRSWSLTVPKFVFQMTSRQQLSAPFIQSEQSVPNIWSLLECLTCLGMHPSYRSTRHWDKDHAVKIHGTHHDHQFIVLPPFSICRAGSRKCWSKSGRNPMLTR
jgi:hypothetical protein